jgi:hypothetical protein
MKHIRKTEELLEEAINDNLYRTKVRNVEDCCSYNLYKLELDNNNITTGELAAIQEVVGDDDLQVEARDNWLYVIATIDDETIEEIRERYDE